MDAQQYPFRLWPQSSVPSDWRFLVVTPGGKLLVTWRDDLPGTVMSMAVLVERLDETVALRIPHHDHWPFIRVKGQLN